MERSNTDAASPPADFVRQIVADDVKAGKNGGRVVTRFPPEPNGYLHLGHVKAICLSFGVAQEQGGRCHLRFDDTNPAKEEREYIEGIEADIRWLGFDWGEHLYNASDYFDLLYEWAVALVKAGKAYVDDLSADQIREYRGTLVAPGRDSPFRNRSVAENLDLLERMKQGEFPDGTRVLRARIDMASPNIVLRDPVMYRILHEEHPRTGRKWCIYPMYDWAHGQNDWMEGVTHSLCDTGYVIHRPLYDWFIDSLIAIGQQPKGIDYRPRQYEFARLNLTYTILSKRKLLELVNAGHVSGWDDPRMPTIRGLRRRGYTPESIRNFAREVGVTTFDSVIDLGRLENALREDLNKRAPRRLAVLHPIKLVIDNYPDGQTEQLEAINNPEDPAAGTRRVPFGKVLYIDQDDFREVPPPKYFRLSPGQEVRLRYAYFVRCTGVVKNEKGDITEIHGTYDPATRGGNAPDGRKVKGTIHWVAAEQAIDADVRLYEPLFNTADPDAVAEGKTWLDNLNPKSMTVVQHAKLEPSLADARAGDNFQFERHGYFCMDRDSRPGAPVFNRSVSLKDSWTKVERKKK